MIDVFHGDHSLGTWVDVDESLRMSDSEVVSVTTLSAMTSQSMVQLERERERERENGFRGGRVKTNQFIVFLPWDTERTYTY